MKNWLKQKKDISNLEYWGIQLIILVMNIMYIGSIK